MLRYNLILRRLFSFERNRLICNGAVLNAAAAASTQIRVHTAGSFSHPDLKISGRTLDRFNVCIREYLDVEMPADLDQFR